MFSWTAFIDLSQNFVIIHLWLVWIDIMEIGIYFMIHMIEFVI